MAINILFLGAGKRLSLLERFLEASQLERSEVKLFSAEITKQVPIANLATIFESPKFTDHKFHKWLFELVKREKIDIIIPNMDAATVSLSLIKKELQSMAVWPVVSSHELCLTMQDKYLANLWFQKYSIQIPRGNTWPRILKLRNGFGSKSQYLINCPKERLKLLKEIDINLFIEQEYIYGSEYSVDAYVNRAGQFISAMPRLRLKVLDGEVDESLSVHKPKIEEISKHILESHRGWEGPITLQFIEDGNGSPVLIEINPRFGGGVTHSIYCGLNMPQWIIREWLERDLPEKPTWKSGSIMTRCRRDIFL